MSFPSADQIAFAIVEACKPLGENPLAVARGNASRARHIAMDALMIAFPDARRGGLAQCIGYRNPKNGQGQAILARKSSWWRDSLVDEVVGALVADNYGEQAK